jgi:hypothetical protein
MLLLQFVAISHSIQMESTQVMYEREALQRKQEQKSSVSYFTQMQHPRFVGISSLIQTQSMSMTLNCTGSVCKTFQQRKEHVLLSGRSMQMRILPFGVVLRPIQMQLTSITCIHRNICEVWRKPMKRTNGEMSTAKRCPESRSSEVLLVHLFCRDVISGGDFCVNDKERQHLSQYEHDMMTMPLAKSVDSQSQHYHYPHSHHRRTLSVLQSDRWVYCGHCPLLVEELISTVDCAPCSVSEQVGHGRRFTLERCLDVHNGS